MKYYLQYKGEDEIVEITKNDARNKLDGWWSPECLDDAFKNNKSFRLFTAFAYIWTKSDDGFIPDIGFCGILE